MNSEEQNHSHVNPLVRIERFHDIWNHVKLASVAKKVTVGIATSSTDAFTSDVDSVPMIKNQNIKDGMISDQNLEHITHEFDLQNKSKRVHTDDIITVRTGYPGLSAVVPDSLNNAQTFTTLVTELNTNELLPKYFVEYINSEHGVRQILKMQAGGAQKNFNAGSLKQFRVALPSIQEQSQLIEVLSAIRSVIETHQQMLESFLEARHWVEQNLLPASKETSPNVRVGTFKNPWESVNIGKFVTENENEKIEDPSADDIMTLGLNMTGLRRNSNRSLKLGATQYYRRHSGQLLYGKQNIFNGSLAIVSAEFDGLVTSKDVPGFDVDSTRIDSEFLLQYLGRKAFYNYLERYAVGIGSKRFHVADFYKVSIGLPSLEEQKAIASVFSKIDDRIKSEENLITDLKEVKRWALDNMFV